MEEDMNFGEVVVAVVAISAIAGVLRTILGGGHPRKAERIMARMAQMQPPQNAETERLREEVRSLKDRVAVLERVITDQSSSTRLDMEFEKLKQMD
jgi:hypothetical protein